jgi:hypothetical protein
MIDMRNELFVKAEQCLLRPPPGPRLGQTRIRLIDWDRADQEIVDRNGQSLLIGANFMLVLQRSSALGFAARALRETVALKNPSAGRWRRRVARRGESRQAL